MLRAILLVLTLALVLAACGDGGGGGDAAVPPAPAEEVGRAHHFDVERVAGGLDRPTWVGAAPGDARGLWALEQSGRVVRLAGGRRRTLLDLGRAVRLGAELGLLGIAFHPRFATNRLLYLHHSDRSGDTRVVEHRMARDGRSIEPRPLRRLLHVDQPEENHNGGHLAFGPDGRLYLGLGDGGGAFDPGRNAQDPRTLLGKLIAADVGQRRPRWEIVMIGLRNPWRYWFDLGLGEVWIADVGQDEVEEVNRVALEYDEPPKNLGWSAYEGDVRIGGDLTEAGELVFPVAVYRHGEGGGCSITGGPVYGGSIEPLRRRYVYGDFCSGALWTLRPAPAGRAEDVRRERATVPQLTHIGTDAAGELVFAAADGSVYRAVAPAGSAG